MTDAQDEGRRANAPAERSAPASGSELPVRIEAAVAGSGAGPRDAVALRYDRDSLAAPEVVAKGSGDVAERILALAGEHGIPVREDRDLLALLSACEVGDEVPAELYVAVAEVLAFLYRRNGELADVR